MTALAQAVATVDPRVRAFCSADPADVFGSWVRPESVWRTDPLDVPEVHPEARDAFARLFNRAAAVPPPAGGGTLLLLGAGGSGKTHLMRAFRHHAHTHGGYAGYLQMICQGGDYARYVLSNLIDALNHPYLDPQTPTPSLTRLAKGLLESLEPVEPDERQRFCEDHLDTPEIVRQVNRFADFALQDGRFDHRDLDLIRALLYLLPNDNRLRARVVKWLRCEDLTPADRELLGGLAAQAADGAPLRTVAGLGRVMAAVHQAPLVLLVDQLEETYDVTADEHESGRRFRQAVDTLVNVAENVRNAVVVVACLDDYFSANKMKLPGTKLHRLEHEPPPVYLRAVRQADEIGAIVARRLGQLFAAEGVDTDPSDPLAPYRQEHLAPLAGLSTRNILELLQAHQHECARAEGWVEPSFKAGGVPGPGTVTPPPSIDFARDWNDALNAAGTPLLAEPELADLLAWAARTASAEVPDGFHFGADPDANTVQLYAHTPDGGADRRLVAVCDARAQGNGLRGQVDAALLRAGQFPVVFVRSTEFPANPKTEIGKKLVAACVPKGTARKVVVSDADRRAMHAFRAFHAARHAEPGFAAWQTGARPLTELAALRPLLDLDHLTTTARPGSPPPPVVGVAREGMPPATPQGAVAEGPLLAGHTRGAAPAPVTIEPRELTQHAAVLGSPGSGKTTAALALIEQLVARGVPAVLLDRKGDLARYADPAAWTVPPADPPPWWPALRDRADVALFTPGATGGRSLALPVVPDGLGALPEAEREQLAGYAAAALWQVMGGRTRANDPRPVILAKAIEVLARGPAGRVTLPVLRRLVDEQDEALVSVAEYDAKHYRRLAEELHTFELRRRRLFEGDEALDVDRLLGRGPHARPGKTRLTVVNTQFLGDPDTVDFWVAQLLVAVGRWAAKNPAPGGDLQAVFLFDEADKYLPASGTLPATKGPMEHLLRRARSAGVGLVLATQSPGDLDYKCRDQVRTWLVGKVTQAVAIGKLKPVLEAGRGDPAARLPGQAAGEFMLARERDVVPVRTVRCGVETRQLPEDRILALAGGRS